MTVRTPKQPVPVRAPHPMERDLTTAVPAGRVGPTTIVKHQHPDYASKNRYDVRCDACGLLATYHAEAWGYDYTTMAECDREAHDQAQQFATGHARICPGAAVPPPPVMVPLSALAVATLLFASEVPVEALNEPDLRDVVTAQFVRCGCNLSRAEADVAYEYGEHPETAAAHMRSCVIAASRLLGVAP